jgi:RNA polymerase sigma factor (sigma-70 family)
MAAGVLADLIHYLHRIGAAQHARELPDEELLRQFTASRDEAAFAALVRRHGPMVLGVCHRVLGDGHLAEDAFQATFLILAKQAGSIRKAAQVAGWLYSTAQRIALRARSAGASRRRRERKAAVMQHSEALDDLTWQELRGVLDEEMGRLPEKYRTPLVLCYFESRSYEQAAKDLGWTKSTLAKRLARARELLRQRLIKRGVSLSITALAAALTEKTTPVAVGAMLAVKTIKAGLAAAAGKMVAGSFVSAQALALAEAGMKVTVSAAGKFAIVALALGLAVGGAGLVSYGALATRRAPDVSPPVTRQSSSQQQSTRQKPTGDVPSQKDQGTVRDLYGDPLPAGAKMRLGTIRFRAGGLVNACDISPNGKWVAIASDDPVVWLFDTATGAPIREFRGHRLEVTCVTFSPDGRFLASGCALGAINLWDAESGKLIRSFESAAPAVRTLAFTPDGKVLLSGGEDKLLHMWDVSSGKEIRKLPGHQETVVSVAISPDGQWAVSGSTDTTVRLWELATGKAIREFTGRNAPENPNGYLAQPVCFSPDGKWIASEMEQGILGVWEAATGNIVCRGKANPDAHVSALAFSPDGKRIAAGTETHELLLWEIPSGKPIGQRSVKRWITYHGGRHKAGIACLAFAPDGKSLIFGEDRQLVMWDIDSKQESGISKAPADRIQRIGFSKDGKSLVSQSEDRRHRLVEWDLASGRMVRPLLPINITGFNEFAFSAEGNLLACRVNWDFLGLWELSSGAKLGQVPLPEQDKAKALQGLAFSPDGTLLVAGGISFTDSSIRIMEAVTGKEVRKLKGHDDGHLGGLAFSPNNKLLTYCGGDNELVIYDLATGKQSRKLTEQPNFAAVFSPDGRFLAALGAKGRNKFGSTSNTRCIRVWDVASGKRLYEFDVGTHPPFRTDTPACPVFSPDSRMLAGADYDGAVHIWEVASGKERRVLQGHRSVVGTLAFSSDGSALASGSADTTVLIWDLWRR